MRSFIATAALFAGLAIAAPAVTDVVYTTTTETIISCAATVTDCPADSTVLATKVYAVTSAPLSTSTVYATDEITITSCAADITDCPARVSTTSYVVSTTVVPYNTPVAKLGPGAKPAVAPYPIPGSWSAGPVAPSGTAPWGTGAPAPTGAVAGAAFASGAAAASASASSTSSSWNAVYTGAASHMNAGAALAGVGAIAALIL